VRWPVAWISGERWPAGDPSGERWPAACGLRGAVACGRSERGAVACGLRPAGSGGLRWAFEPLPLPRSRSPQAKAGDSPPLRSGSVTRNPVACGSGGLRERWPAVDLRAGAVACGSGGVLFVRIGKNKLFCCVPQLWEREPMCEKMCDCHRWELDPICGNLCLRVGIVNGGNLLPCLRMVGFLMVRFVYHV